MRDRLWTVGGVFAPAEFLNRPTRRDRGAFGAIV
jgi:hypothetical protein